MGQIAIKSQLYPFSSSKFLQFECKVFSRMNQTEICWMLQLREVIPSAVVERNGWLHIKPTNVQAFMVKAMQVICYMEDKLDISY